MGPKSSNYHGNSEEVSPRMPNVNGSSGGGGGNIFGSDIGHQGVTLIPLQTLYTHTPTPSEISNITARSAASPRSGMHTPALSVISNQERASALGATSRASVHTPRSSLHTPRSMLGTPRLEQSSDVSSGGKMHIQQPQQQQQQQRERDDVQLVALNLERRWHGIWLQSLEWQCRLEEALARRKGVSSPGLDFSSFQLPVLDESLFGRSSQNLNAQGFIELDDDSLLFIGRCEEDLADCASSSSVTSESCDSYSFSGCGDVTGFNAADHFASFPLSLASPLGSPSRSPYSSSDVIGEGVGGGVGGGVDGASGDPRPSSRFDPRFSGSGGDITPPGQRSPARPSTVLLSPDSPLGKRPFPDTGNSSGGSCGGGASPAKRGSPTPTSSSGGLSPVTPDAAPIEELLRFGVNSSAFQHVVDNTDDEYGDVLITDLQDDDDYDDSSVHESLKVKRSLLFDRSSGDSANISEAESKMGDSPRSSGSSGILSPPGVAAGRGAGNGGGGAGAGVGAGGYVVTSSDGELDPPSTHRAPPPVIVGVVSKSEVRDIGYSSESQSNDEVDVMRHQIDLEYKFPGKCEVASDGPLGDKVTMPSTKVKPQYYYMTHVDLDSTDRTTDNGDTTDSGPERVKDDVKSSSDGHGGYRPEADRFEAAVKEVYSELKDDDNGSCFPGQMSSRGHSGSNCEGGSAAVVSSSSSSSSSSAVRGHFGVSELVATGKSSASSATVSPLYIPDDDDTEDVTMLAIKPLHELLDISESDSAPESKEKKSIRYLIEHAEDLVKPPSPTKTTFSAPSSPSKHLQSPIVVQQQQQHQQHQLSPSKQTQTDSCSAVESSCDASGEDNSDHEAAAAAAANASGSGGTRDEFSTATDDADETLIGSVINLDSATESARNTSTDDIISTTCSGVPRSPRSIPHTLVDSPRLRKQTGESSSSRRRGKDRPWSVVGLQDFSSNSRGSGHGDKMGGATTMDAVDSVAHHNHHHNYHHHVASSESAIDHIFQRCQTDTDSSSSNAASPMMAASSFFFSPSSHSSTFPRESHQHNHHPRRGFRRALSSTEHQSPPSPSTKVHHSHASSSTRRKLKYSSEVAPAAADRMTLENGLVSDNGGGPLATSETPVPSSSLLCSHSKTGHYTAILSAEATSDSEAPPSPSKVRGQAPSSPGRVKGQQRRTRRLRHRSSLESGKEVSVSGSGGGVIGAGQPYSRSSATDSYDSAEAESESETA
ncbi:platelet binding protein GspB, partial [Aplysia californica]|uniref:Platelet binding protein GspB n=1 Tax=Aplysia californica TaxID=6500 RepID=A0ABM1AEZ7_APLCA